MDIECKLKREGGTHVDIEAVKYHFAPRDDGAHVAAVASEAHQDRFLAIPEAYRVYRGSAALTANAGPSQEKRIAQALSTMPAAAPIGAQSAPEHPTLLSAPGYLDGYEFHGKTYAFAEIVDLAHKGSGLDAKEWNELEDESRADLIDEQLDKLNGGDGEPDQSEERAALAAQYREKFGKAPHGKWNAAKIREQLEAGV